MFADLTSDNLHHRSHGRLWSTPSSTHVADLDTTSTSIGKVAGFVTFGLASREDRPRTYRGRIDEATSAYVSQEPTQHQSHVGEVAGPTITTTTPGRSPSAVRR